MKSRNPVKLTVEEQSKKEFIKLRLKITGICLFIILVVLAIVLSVLSVNEYNSKINFVEEVLNTAIDDSVKGVKTIDELVAKSTEYNNYVKIGEGSDYNSSSYIPIILYQADYSHNILLPINVQSAQLTDETMSNAQEFLSSSSGFYFTDTSSLAYLKKKTPVGDLIAFTDVSSIDEYMNTFKKTFTYMTLLLLFFMAVSIWALSNWIVRPVKDMWMKQQRFIADASHELKTPVNVIMANADLLKNKKAEIDFGEVKSNENPLKENELIIDLDSDEPILGIEYDTQDAENKMDIDVYSENNISKQDVINQVSEYQKEVSSFAGTIYDESEKMRVLIEDMLYLLTDKALLAKKTTIDLSRLCLKESMMFEAKAFEKENQLNYENIGSDIMVYADEYGITRVLAILFDNACKYAEPKSNIDIKIEADKKIAKLSITNQGPTIPEEDLEAIFDRFFRMDNARTRTSDASYGLGLAMAKDIMLANDGKIYAESKDNLITFILELPLAKEKHSSE